MTNTAIDIKSTMSKNLITISNTEALDVAYAKMVRHEIRHLPVVDESGTVVGILSDRDLQRALRSKVAGDGPFRFESCEFNPADTVQDYMSWPIKSLDQGTSVKLAAERLITEKISAFVVTDHGNVVGIVTTEDLLKVLVNMLNRPTSGFKWTLQELVTNPRLGQLAQAISDTGI